MRESSTLRTFGRFLAICLLLAGCAESVTDDPDQVPIDDDGGADVSVDDAPQSPLDDAKVSTSDGTTPPQDAGAGVDAKQPDATTDTGSIADTGPVGTKAAAGDLLVTEVMFNPSGTEPDQEWIEVYNLASGARVLNGLILQDSFPRTHTIAATPPVSVPSLGYVLLVRNKAAAMAAGLPTAKIAYEYGVGETPTTGILLTNGATGIITILSGATKVSEVAYGAFSLSAQGKTIQLKGLVIANQGTSSSWCQSANAWAGVDKGTPGLASDCP